MTKEFKEECLRLVQWGVDNGMVRRGPKMAYSVATIKRSIQSEGGLIGNTGPYSHVSALAKRRPH